MKVRLGYLTIIVNDMRVEIMFGIIAIVLFLAFRVAFSLEIAAAGLAIAGYAIAMATARRVRRLEKEKHR
jgi:hypothetical protein